MYTPSSSENISFKNDTDTTCVLPLATEVIALIDYDNLNVLMRRRGVRHVLGTLLNVLGSRRFAVEREMLCRLYGGWFYRDSLSRGAQRILPYIRQDFPQRMSAIDKHGAGTVLVRVELARSLVCDSRIELTHTYRQRSLPPNLRCAAAPFPNCTDPVYCPIAGLTPFIRNGKCPVDGCAVDPQEVLERAEQKLVDSMLIIDLVHLAQTKTEHLVVVSADDDLWPGIRFALLSGASVIHVIPRQGQSVPNRYRYLETPAYERVEM